MKSGRAKRTTKSSPTLIKPNDFLSMVRKSVELSTLVDEERDYLMQRAPNAIEWVTGSRYCNQPSLFQHWGAYRLIKEFFELRCPNCNKYTDSVSTNPWGLSRESLESEVLLVWTPKHEDDACPKCGTTRSEFVDRGIFNNHRVLHAIIGQRAGKSSTLALIGTYVEHVVLTVAHEQQDGTGLYRYLGIPHGDLLHVTYVASTDTQSKETVWAKYRGYRKLSPWFKRYVPWIKGKERMQETPDGMQRWEYSESDKSIKNQLIGLEIDSLNSNSNGLAGRTRIASFIDEICRMKQTDSSQGAQEIYRTMDASCQTVQGAVDQFGLIPWFGMIGSISSPIATEDYGMQLLEVAKSDPRMYAMHLATWDFNPWQPKSRFEDLLKKDEVGTMRNFGAVPPLAASPLIDRPNDFKKSAIDVELRPTATFKQYEFLDSTGRSMVGVKLDRAELMIREAPRFVAVDAGKNFDAFSVACAHGEKDADGNVVTVYDWIIRLLTKSRQQEVYFESVFQVLKEINQSMIIKTIEFDHWNSTTIVQRLRNELMVFAEEVVTTNEHFIQFMRDAYSGYVRMLPELANDHALDPPYKSPQGAAIYELLHLERDEKDKVFNSRKGLRRGWDSDDTARVIVHVHRLVQDQGYTERQDDVSRRARRKRAEASIADWSAMNRGQVFDATNGRGRAPFIPTGVRKW